MYNPCCKTPYCTSCWSCGPYASCGTFGRCKCIKIFQFPSSDVPWKKKIWKSYKINKVIKITFQILKVIQFVSTKMSWLNKQYLVRKIFFTLLEKVFFFRSPSGPVPKKCPKCYFFTHKLWFVAEKEHFLQIKNIFDSNKRTSLAPLRYWT
jgi:hypothetical protein